MAAAFDWANASNHPFQSIDLRQTHYVTPDQLRKLTFKNLYNTLPTWLAHAVLDRASWTAYGWPPNEDPATVPEETILERLLALNGERAE